jgi:hypothetical protein
MMGRKPIKHLHIPNDDTAAVKDHGTIRLVTSKEFADDYGGTDTLIVNYCLFTFGGVVVGILLGFLWCGF